MTSDYYSHPYVSNSTLSKLKDELSPSDHPDRVANYAFGKLFHALLTEPHTVDHINFKVGDTGYFPEEFAKARGMRDAALKNPFVAAFNKVSQKEFEVYRDSLNFNVDGVEFELPVRIKMDEYNPSANIILDYKSTAETTHKGFYETIDLFDVDRQAAMYLLVSDAEKFLVMGVSKKRPYNTFPVFITRQHEYFKSGVKKLNDLALKYFLIKC